MNFLIFYSETAFLCFSVAFLSIQHFLLSRSAGFLCHFARRAAVAARTFDGRRTLCQAAVVRAFDGRRTTVATGCMPYPCARISSR